MGRCEVLVTRGLVVGGRPSGLYCVPTSAVGRFGDLKAGGGPCVLEVEGETDLDSVKLKTEVVFEVEGCGDLVSRLGARNEKGDRFEEEYLEAVVLSGGEDEDISMAQEAGCLVEPDAQRFSTRWASFNSRSDQSSEARLDTTFK